MKKRPKNFIDLTGKRFHMLKVIKYIGNSKFKCQCDCGKITTPASVSLRKGLTKSCGCLSHKSLGIRNRKHGYSGTPTYQSWANMVRRCTDKNAKDYRYYGGRGIKVCIRWLKFENFLKDMGEKPEGMTIERVHNDRDYKPSNCKWATMSEQNRNKRKKGSCNES